MDPDTFDPAHGQGDYRVRMDWGPTGAAATSASYAVVVDVLSFTTTVSVALDQGIEVFPYRWRDKGAAAHAMRHAATLAVGRFEALGLEGRHVSLSPASLREAHDLERLVLPSPNGSAICFELASPGVQHPERRAGSAARIDSGPEPATVLAASLRNRHAVAQWLARKFFRAGQLEHRPSVSVIAAGERWADGSLRPCVEDLWGAGAVIAALVDLGVEGLSPEAVAAEQAFRAAEPEIATLLAGCAGGRELADKGFAADVAVAAELDASSVVPLLADESFTDAEA
ncbi:MAG TPA: 2-phosphosulfolactate phosphatase [Nocardioides sp.]